MDMSTVLTLGPAGSTLLPFVKWDSVTPTKKKGLGEIQGSPHLGAGENFPFLIELAECINLFKTNTRESIK